MSPESVCPKCGSDQGWEGPRYGYVSFVIVGENEPPHSGEWLAFRCLTCGYERREPTKDAQPPAIEVTRVPISPEQQQAVAAAIRRGREEARKAGRRWPWSRT